jgi:hypothetical protein
MSLLVATRSNMRISIFMHSSPKDMSSIFKIYTVLRSLILETVTNIENVRKKLVEKPEGMKQGLVVKREERI